MTLDPLVALLTCDLGAIVRGRSIVASKFDDALDTGVGWVPVNHSISPVGAIAEPNPFGSIGDLRLRPDPATRVAVQVDTATPALEFALCDMVNVDGSPWTCCTRTFLRDAVEQLRSVTGGAVRASFEHEFQLLTETPPEAAFSLAAQRAAEPFPSLLMTSLESAGVEPECFLAEYGHHQFEVPCAPADGVAAADRSVTFKEVVRDVARHLGRRVTFAPLSDPAAVGNGTHIHLSLVGDAGEPLLHDPGQPGGLSRLGGQFAAGILHHSAALVALTAPSPVSALRLTPHRWSASAAYVASGDREALVRIPPLLGPPGQDAAHQFNLEYRAADATANPYLALGAILLAGLDGVRRELPAPAVSGGGEHASPLPATLEAALVALDQDPQARGWLDPLLHEAYVGVKRAELHAVRAMESAALCRLYASIY